MANKNNNRDFNKNNENRTHYKGQEQDMTKSHKSTSADREENSLKRENNEHKRSEK